MDNRGSRSFDRDLGRAQSRLAEQTRNAGPYRDGYILTMWGFEGRDRLHRFLPGDEWKKLPESCKAPNKGRRLRPRLRHIVSFFCELCGVDAKRHRRSARYCSVECRRRVQSERDALKKGRPRPAERARGSRGVGSRLRGVSADTAVTANTWDTWQRISASGARRRPTNGCRRCFRHRRNG